MSDQGAKTFCMFGQPGDLLKEAMMMTRIFWVTVLCLISTRSVFSAAQFINLSSTPPGGAKFNIAYGVSDENLMAVGATGVATSDGGNEAAIWTLGSGRAGLGQLAGVAYGISGNGHVVVGRSGPLLGDMAYRWTDASGVVGLGYLPNGLQSEARRTNSDGSVIVGHSDDGSASQAFRWTQATGMISIGQGIAKDVSEDGAVIVGSNEGGAFRWTFGTGQVTIGPEVATACSSDGAIVVGYGHFEPQGVQAWVWNQNDGVKVLDDLPGGGFRSEAHAISGDGKIIVGSGQGFQGEEAVLWDSAHGVRSIKAMLVDDFGLDLPDYNFTKALDISHDGSVIVGVGYDLVNEGQAAWMVIVPEPSALLAVFITGGLSISRRGVRQPRTD